jgi:hypothetical protein
MKRDYGMHMREPVSFAKVQVLTDAGVRAARYLPATAPSYPSLYPIIEPQALNTILANHYKEDNFLKPCSIVLNLISKCISASALLSGLMYLLVHRLHPPLSAKRLILRQRMV